MRAIIISIVAALLVVLILEYTQLTSDGQYVINAHSILLSTSTRSNNIDIPVYYINMDKSVERNESMQEQFRILGIQGTRIPGVIADVNNPFDSRLTQSEEGCTLAHLNAIRTAYDNGDEYALILEDDTSLLLSPLWKQTLSSLIENDAPKDWTIINMTPNKPPCSTGPSPFVKFNEDSAGCSTGSYIINRIGMHTLLQIKLPGTGKEPPFADFLVYDIPGSYEYIGKGLFYLENCPSDLLSTSSFIRQLICSYRPIKNAYHTLKDEYNIY
jgi:GR25 family glycosyltransferase involved in LPS biosynthesis